MPSVSSINRIVRSNRRIVFNNDGTITGRMNFGEKKFIKRKYFLELDSDADSHDESDNENENSAKPEVRILNELIVCFFNLFFFSQVKFLLPRLHLVQLIYVIAVIVVVKFV